MSTLARLKRPGITGKLFVAVLATATLVAVAVGVAAQWSFQRGFLGYLNTQAVLRMEVVMPRLTAAYAEHGDWDFLRNRRDLWFSLVGIGPPHPPEPREPPDSPPKQRPSGPMAELIASDLLGAGRRLSLLDAQRQRVVGFPFIMANSEQREIVVDGRTVGWLAMAPIETVTDSAAVAFLDRQLLAAAAAVVLAVLLSAAIAWWVARALLAPVRAVAGATHRLAAGAYDTRVELAGEDEVAQLAQDFNQLALTLERNERLRRDFMADVSHELRTPLAVLRGELEALEDGVHQPTPELLRRLQQEVAMLAQLVGDLHELALADVGALAFRQDELDLVPLVRSEVGALQAKAAERGLELQARLPAAALPVSGDERRLRQLLLNLLSNSLRYTDPGGTVRVELAAEGTDAVLDLQDSAPGVPEELLPRLFERFFRVEASRSRAKGGSGLGLAIARSLAEAHGGRLEARPSPLGGLWIRLVLPRLRPRGEGESA
ncbi:two-component system sensor histidine kinase BaeS [Rubrivivax gelatinosus]|uniref:ATP-binding protein n=1 Tax=Rubrivivax gelatinosus TaxID=28068 RepID=UPI0018CA870B|nr:ATP-binding protein [Rubrivivax gelatinosus]MBG6080856.1 two-component system sensor histidine kinase BaeS [Rubrivivax gelatinosus]